MKDEVKQPYRFPQWLYNLLPLIYIVSGFSTILILQNPMGIFSGMVLISAAALVHHMRRWS